MTWTRFADKADGSYLESPIVISASSNYGRTFSPYRRIDTTLGNFKSGGLTPFSQGSNPKVGRDGAVYVAYEGVVCASLACDHFGNGDRDVTVVATSTDHGVTFKHTVIDTNYDLPFYQPLGTSTLTGENFRVNSFPQLAYDRKTDLLAVVWNDDRHSTYDASTGASIKSNADNIVAFSRGGLNWSPTVTVGTPQDEVFGAVAIESGVVAITSYTRHYAPTGIDLDYAYWTSLDLNGNRTLPIHRITTASSNPQIQFVSTDAAGHVVQGTFIGDYTGAILGSDLVLHPCWMDFRGKPYFTKPNQDSYTESIPLSTGGYGY